MIVSILTIIGAVIWSVLKRRELIVSKLFKADTEDIDMEKSITYPQAFNLMCVLLGLFLLVGLVSNIIIYANSLFLLGRVYLRTHSEQTPSQFYRHFTHIFGYVVKLAIAIYLLYGAPHFAKWQHSKTKEMIKELEEN